VKQERPTPVDPRELALAAGRAAAEKQAEDVVILDVGAVIAITDLFLLCTGATQRQVKTIVDAIEERLRELGEHPVRREGGSENRWVLLDYVDVVIHVFAPEERDFYDLERLWRDAPVVPMEAGEDAGAATSR
jgi:ribosome-associated protein